jgi:hypothetical protein
MRSFARQPGFTECAQTGVRGGRCRASIYPMTTLALPPWAADLVVQYESQAASQFILHGNVQDRFVLPLASGPELGSLSEFLLKALMPRFDVVLSYDLGNGIRVDKGGEHFSQWPALKENADLPRTPRAAIETLTRYFRYSANLARLGKPALHVGCLIHSAQLVAPADPGSSNYDLNALALLMRDWGTEELLAQYPLVTILVADTLNDLHPLLVTNPRAATVKVPLPRPEDLEQAFGLLAPRYSSAIIEFKADLGNLAAQMTGVTLQAAENLLKVKEYKKAALRSDDLIGLKKTIVEKECQDLIEFIESKRTLDDIHGQTAVKEWLRQDIALWKKSDREALPMGYLFCGPVGTGKTFLVESIAGEAGIPVVKIRNFRDKWVGSTEGNLEKIFRLLHALDRCFVFIDEADQALGKRESGTSDSGLSGRIYAMIAKEMSDPDNRGRILWVLASSRPDLIEVDLKRPGRIDVKIPIFPTATAKESFDLLRALCGRRKVVLEPGDFGALEPKLPMLMTPGAAEALAMKIYRATKTRGLAARPAVEQALSDYQPPIAREILEFQIGLAVNEASEWEFVPEAFRDRRTK